MYIAHQPIQSNVCSPYGHTYWATVCKKASVLLACAEYTQAHSKDAFKTTISVICIYGK